MAFDGDERRRGMPADDGADLREHDVGEALLGGHAAAGRGEEALGIGDPPGDEAVDDEVLLVLAEELRGHRREGEQALVEPDDGFEGEGALDAEAGLLHDADHAAEAQEKAVLGHVDDHEAGPDGERRQEAADEREGPPQRCHGLLLPPNGWSSQRSKSFRSPAPGRRIFCVVGRTSSSASMCRRKRVRSGARRYSFSRRVKASASPSASKIFWSLKARAVSIIAAASPSARLTASRAKVRSEERRVGSAR